MTDERKRLFDGKRIGVLMGGISGEREVSLRSGKMVYESLLNQGLDAVALDLKEEAVETILAERINIAFVILHGRGGEDGIIQGVLEQLKIPYTGSGVLASALSMNKVYSKRLFRLGGVETPEYLSLDPDRDLESTIEDVESRFDYSMVLKPVSEGSSLGVSIIHDRDEFRRCYSEGREKFGGLFVERYIPGKCVTVGVLGSGSGARPLPVLELVPQNEFYDYEAKYTSGSTEFICPADLVESVYRECQRLALDAHRILGLQGFSRLDMQIDDAGTVFVLEANSIPGMTELSDLPAEARACGMSYDELVFEILLSSLEKKTA